MFFLIMTSRGKWQNFSTLLTLWLNMIHLRGKRTQLGHQNTGRQLGIKGKKNAGFHGFSSGWYWLWNLQKQFLLSSQFSHLSSEKIRITTLLILGSPCNNVEYNLQVHHGFMSSFILFITVLQKGNVFLCILIFPRLPPSKQWTAFVMATSLLPKPRLLSSRSLFHRAAFPLSASSTHSNILALFSCPCVFDFIILFFYF